MMEDASRKAGRIAKKDRDSFSIKAMASGETRVTQPATGSVFKGIPSQAAASHAQVPLVPISGT
jgi:hypothetical protein